MKKQIECWNQMVMNGGVHREVIGALVHVHDGLPAKLISDDDDRVNVCLVGLDEFVVGGFAFHGFQCIGSLLKTGDLDPSIHEIIAMNGGMLDAHFEGDGNGDFACTFEVIVDCPDRDDGPFDDDLPF